MQIVSAVLVLALSIAQAGAQAPTTKPPNILVIWGDDIDQFNVSA